MSKTKLGTLVIAPTHEAAQAKLEAIAWRPGSPLLGDPDAVAEQLAEYLAAGLDGYIVHMPDVYDLESVALAGRALASAIGR